MAWLVLVFGCVHAPPSGGGGRWAGRSAAGDAAGGHPRGRATHRRDVSSSGPRVCRARRRGGRRRPCADDGSATGVLFGMAFLCKQFALLPLLAVLVAVPGWRQRARVALPALVVVGCGIIPFVAVDPSGTWSTLSAVNAGAGGQALHRDRRRHDRPVRVDQAPDRPRRSCRPGAASWRCGRAGASAIVCSRRCALIGLTTACLAGRLVAEVWFASYYLLAVSVGLLVLDLASRRLPGAVVPLDRRHRRPGRAVRRSPHHTPRRVPGLRGVDRSVVIGLRGRDLGRCPESGTHATSDRPGELGGVEAPPDRVAVASPRSRSQLGRPLLRSYSQRSPSSHRP